MVQAAMLTLQMPNKIFIVQESLVSIGMYLQSSEHRGTLENDASVSNQWGSRNRTKRDAKLEGILYVNAKSSSQVACGEDGADAVDENHCKYGGAIAGGIIPISEENQREGIEFGEKEEVENVDYNAANAWRDAAAGGESSSTKRWVWNPDGQRRPARIAIRYQTISVPASVRMAQIYNISVEDCLIIDASNAFAHSLRRAPEQEKQAPERFKLNEGIASKNKCVFTDRDRDRTRAVVEGNSVFPLLQACRTYSYAPMNGFAHTRSEKALRRPPRAPTLSISGLYHPYHDSLTVARVDTTHLLRPRPAVLSRKSLARLLIRAHDLCVPANAFWGTINDGMLGAGFGVRGIQNRWFIEACFSRLADLHTDFKRA
ncbi:hypothetical protein B0H13DRAFT_1883735 [Mycena leptocephala]|nr:hypothetical protein B0H13DRAFT_1883735 [Mycena leptocephala]